MKTRRIATATTTSLKTRQTTQRNMVQPPYSKSVKTNVAQKFLLLIDKHFPPSNKLHKIFNRHTVRVSYFINKHNNKILNSKHPQHAAMHATGDNVTHAPSKVNVSHRAWFTKRRLLQQATTKLDCMLVLRVENSNPDTETT